MIVRWLLVVICVTEPAVEIVALPATTVPPVGAANAPGDTHAKAAAPTSAVVDSTPPREPTRLPFGWGRRLRLRRSSKRRSRRR